MSTVFSVTPAPWTHCPAPSPPAPAHPHHPRALGWRLLAAAGSAILVGLIGVGAVPLASPPAAEGSALVPEGLSAAERAVLRKDRLSAQSAEVARAQQVRLAETRARMLAGQASRIQAEAERLASQFAWPTAGAVGVPFGVRPHPILKKNLLHNGVDIGGACGQSVVAPADGTVSFVGRADDAGVFLRIDHGVIEGRSVRTTYLHLSAVLVTLGEPVSRGQVVGRVGATGLATSCHLHFSTVENGIPVDPMAYLRP